MAELAPFTPRIFDGAMGAASRSIGLPPLFHAVGGDGMAPTLNEGDYAVVDRGALRFAADGLWLIRFADGAARVRRLVAGPGRVFVLCDNPAYRTEEIAYDELVILGRVCGAIKRL